MSSDRNTRSNTRSHRKAANANRRRRPRPPAQASANGTHVRGLRLSSTGAITPHWPIQTASTPCSPRLILHAPSPSVHCSSHMPTPQYGTHPHHLSISWPAPLPPAASPQRPPTPGPPPDPATPHCTCARPRQHPAAAVRQLAAAVQPPAATPRCRTRAAGRPPRSAAVRSRRGHPPPPREGRRSPARRRRPPPPAGQRRRWTFGTRGREVGREFRQGMGCAPLVMSAVHVLKSLNVLIYGWTPRGDHLGPCQVGFVPIGARGSDECRPCNVAHRVAMWRQAVPWLRVALAAATRTRGAPT